MGTVRTTKYPHTGGRTLSGHLSHLMTTQKPCTLAYMSLWDELLNTLFPEHCVNCGRPGNVLCAICERGIIMNPQALTKNTAVLFDYRTPLVKKAIRALKYERKKSLATFFGTALYREFFKQLIHNNKIPDDIVLIPVPPSKKATWKRGYNHAALIAKTIVSAGKDDGLTLTLHTNILYKKHENAQQARMKGPAARKQNVAHLFGIHHGEALTGKTVILIDDVITTGATTSAARSALRTAKPKRMLTIAVAH